MNLQHAAIAAALAVMVVAGCATVPDPVPATPSLQDVIEREMSTPDLQHALWGILIEDESGRTLARHNASTLMMPASNRKVLVSAFAAGCLGLDTTLSTELWIEGDVRDGVLKGDVVIRGGGDPSLGGRYESDRDLRLMPFVEALRNRGIRLVEGDIVADVSLFSRETIPGSWKNNNLGESYAAPVDALAFNENVVGYLAASEACGALSITPDPHFVSVGAEVSCGSELELQAQSTELNHVELEGITGKAAASTRGIVAIEQPGLYAGHALSDLLGRHGIGVSGSVRLHAQPKQWKERLSVIESPPVYFLLTTVLKNSQNLYAEMLFRASAREHAPVSYQAARSAEEDYLTTAVGLGMGQFYSADGSGLSPENMVTPEAMVRAFRHLYEPGRRNVFYSLLATPGESGTLRRRLAGLEDRMRGKTGTINGVSALSGYVLMPDESVRFFSLIVNHHLSTSSVAEAAMDRIVQRLSDIP